MKYADIRILPGFYILIAAAILLIPFRWLAAWITAAFIHEIFHVLFLRLMGYHILSVEIGMTGANIKTDGHSGVKMSICALAGPLSGFLLLFLLRVAPRLALCGTIQSLYNLIPVCPLDGGRIIKGLVESVFSDAMAKRILLFWEDTVLLLLAAVAIYASVKLRLGMYPVLLVGILIFRNKKIPCKQRHLRVQ